MKKENIQLVNIRFNYQTYTNWPIPSLNSMDITALYNGKNKIEITINTLKELTPDEIKEEIIKRFS